MILNEEGTIMGALTTMNYDRETIFKKIIESIKELEDKIIILEGKNAILEEDVKTYNSAVIKRIVVGSNIGVIAPIYNGRNFDNLLAISENVPFQTMIDFFEKIRKNE